MNFVRLKNGMTINTDSVAAFSCQERNGTTLVEVLFPYGGDWVVLNANAAEKLRRLLLEKPEGLKWVYIYSNSRFRVLLNVEWVTHIEPVDKQKDMYDVWFGVGHHIAYNAKDGEKPDCNVVDCRISSDYLQITTADFTALHEMLKPIHIFDNEG